MFIEEITGDGGVTGRTSDSIFGAGIKTDSLSRNLENERTNELYEGLLKKFRERFPDKIPARLSKNQIIDIRFTDDLQPPMTPVDLHIFIRYDKIIIQRTTKDGNDLDTVIDRNSKEPEHILHRVKKVKDNKYDLKDVKKEFDEEKFNHIISTYMSSPNLECETKVENMNEYRPIRHEMIEGYNGYIDFDSYLDDLCENFNINRDDLKKKTTIITYQNYKLMINEDEISVEGPGNKNSTFNFSVSKDSAHGKEIFNNLFVDTMNMVSHSKFIKLIKQKEKHYNVIRFDEVKFDEIVELLKMKKNECEIKSKSR